ncbi:MAG TPA: phosphoglycerate kinase [Clostridiales bacterium]|nr:MAG: phosphoglycerate kinase [Clostridiales bacterium GWD2_32_59]HAN09474.1 phosphoglycerate kinase [Clostridiales bacterium]
MSKKTIYDIDIRGKRVLVRCDFNVKIRDGVIVDDSKLKKSLNTIEKLVSDGAKVILCSHLGRPDGKPVPNLSLSIVAERLSDLLECDVKFADDDNVISSNVKEMVYYLEEKEIILLQNLRYNIGETECDDNFAKNLASLGEIFVNDAFGTLHRKHASNLGVTKYIKDCVIGHLVESELREIENLKRDVTNKRVIVLGGVKIGALDIEYMLNNFDTIMLGDPIAYDFLKAQGHYMGGCSVNEYNIEKAKEIMKLAYEIGTKIVLPKDIRGIDRDLIYKNIFVEEIYEDFRGRDIGDETIKNFCEIIKNAELVVWRGTVGKYKIPECQKGTNSILKAMKDSPAKTCCGGGTTSEIAYTLGMPLDYISSGGGALLEVFNGNDIPSLNAILDKEGQVSGEQKNLDILSLEEAEEYLKTLEEHVELSI